MIYLKDQATGVTVEDSKAVDGWVRVAPGPTPLTPSPLPAHFPSEQAGSLLRGLLRWKLETEEGDCAEDKVYGVEEWVTRVTGTWLKERS